MIHRPQEWVDFDFEMRLYFLPPPEWPKAFNTSLKLRKVKLL